MQKNRYGGCGPQTVASVREAVRGLHKASAKEQQPCLELPGVNAESCSGNQPFIIPPWRDCSSTLTAGMLIFSGTSVVCRLANELQLHRGDCSRISEQPAHRATLFKPDTMRNYRRCVILVYLPSFAIRITHVWNQMSNCSWRLHMATFSELSRPTPPLLLLRAR